MDRGMKESPCIQVGWTLMNVIPVPYKYFKNPGIDGFPPIQNDSSHWLSCAKWNQRLFSKRSAAENPIMIIEASCNPSSWIARDSSMQLTTLVSLPSLAKLQASPRRNTRRTKLGHDVELCTWWDGTLRASETNERDKRSCFCCGISADPISHDEEASICLCLGMEPTQIWERIW